MSKPIAIVLDPWDLPFNGGVVSSRRFIRALEAQGHDFRILCSEDNLSETRYSDSSSTTDDLVVFDALSIPGFNRIIRGMKVLLAKPDREKVRQALVGCRLLHVQFPFFLGFVAIEEAVKLGIPIVCTFHVQPENLLMNVGIKSRLLSKILYRIFLKFIYERADLVIAPSQFACDLLKTQGLKAPTEVISNGVPESFLQLSKVHGSESELMAENGEFYILSVGRLSGEKRQDLLIAAISKSKYSAKIHLRIVGVGPNEEKLKRLLLASGVRGRIGSVSDEELLQCHRETDLFVHSGEIELEGMSVVEAMAASNVVLVSDSRDSASGLFALSEHALFKVGDILDLSQKIDYWIENRLLRIEQGRANREYIQQYKHANCIQLLADIYERVASIEIERQLEQMRA
ncbi:MAG: glycosyltransferase [Pseudomonadales bacterium]